MIAGCFGFGLNRGVWSGGREIETTIPIVSVMLDSPAPFSLSGVES